MVFIIMNFLKKIKKRQKKKRKEKHQNAYKIKHQLKQIIYSEEEIPDAAPLHENLQFNSYELYSKFWITQNVSTI